MNHRDPRIGSRSLDVSPYDLLLAVIPLCLALGVGAASVLPVSASVGVLAGGVSSALVLGYGLFYRAPIEYRRSGTGS